MSTKPPPMISKNEHVRSFAPKQVSQSTRRQRGTALVMSLLILLILTMLGVTAMGTSSLQEKMSTGVQESMRSFQLAESALQTSMVATGTFDLSQETTKSSTFGGGTYKVKTKFIAMSPPKRGSGFSSVDYDGANFDQQGSAIGYHGSNAIIHRGVVQIMTKQK